MSVKLRGKWRESKRLGTWGEGWETRDGGLGTGGEGRGARGAEEVENRELAFSRDPQGSASAVRSRKRLGSADPRWGGLWEERSEPCSVSPVIAGRPRSALHAEAPDSQTPALTEAWSATSRPPSFCLKEPVIS